MLCNKSLLIFLDALHTAVDSFYTGMFSEWHFQDFWMTFRWLLMTFWWLAIRPRKLKYDFRCLCMIWTCWHWHIMKNSTMLNILFKSYINHFFLFSGKTNFLVDSRKATKIQKLNSRSWNEIIWTPQILWIPASSELYTVNYVTVKASKQ